MSLAIPLSDKVTGRHRDRTAVVYLRQSTPQQVGRHPESTRLQYGLVDRALQLGWARERILVGSVRSRASLPADGPLR
jgi:hypothetical protein